MGIDVHNKYLGSQPYPLTEHSQEILAEIVAATGFSGAQEIFRGLIYKSDKVGTISYKGLYQGKVAVLKLQGLKPELDENKDIEAFNAQNQSSLVKVPQVYAYENWSEEKGYGYTITEFIDAPRIFTMPFATIEQMQEFARFYQDYKTAAVIKPWIDPEERNALEFTKKRHAGWKASCEKEGRLSESDYLPYFERFTRISEQYFEELELEFCHAHITSNDICVTPQKTYVLFSNLFWKYRPQWYDLSFNIWACMQYIRDVDYTFDQLQAYVEQWVTVYKEIPVFKADPQFEKKFYLNLMERMMGAIFMDLGVNETFGRPENQNHLKHLLRLHQQLFDYLEKRIQSFD